MIVHFGAADTHPTAVTKSMMCLWKNAAFLKGCKFGYMRSDGCWRGRCRTTLDACSMRNLRRLRWPGPDEFTLPVDNPPGPSYLSYPLPVIDDRATDI